MHTYVQDLPDDQTLVLDSAPSSDANGPSPGVLPTVQAGDSPEIALSSTGGVVAFSSNAANLVPGDDNGGSDVFVQDTATGQTTLVSDLPSGISGQPSLSASGQLVAFTNDVDQPVALPGPFGETILTNEPFGNVYVSNLSTGALTLVSANTRRHGTR